jgi:hypothetical protein
MSAGIPTDRRWWQYKRVWFIGVPVALILSFAGLYAWGTSQPKPEGFAPTIETQTAPSTDDGARADESVQAQESAVAQESAPIDEEPAMEEADPGQEPIRYTVDARSKQEWILFDFNTGELVDGDFTAPGWDIALQRTKALTNSGVTNPSGPGGAYDLGEVPLAEAIAPATAVFEVDVLAGEDEDEPENPAIGGWYRYSFIKHVVSVKPNTYLVRTGEDQDALVQFDSYYCEDEEPACITFSYLMVPKVEATIP